MNASAQLSFINSRSLAMRASLLVVVLLAVGSAFYGACWQFGRALAESFSPNLENAQQTASLAVRLAPSDSQAHSVSGKISKGFVLTQIQENALKDYQTAVRLAPHDYRFWLELGRVREQVDGAASGETALRRAVELAPNYAYPRWLLGNLLLRDGKQEEAFAEFKRAAESHSVLRQQVFYLVWETTGGDADKIKELFGDTPAVRAALATFYAAKKLPDESLAMWQSLSAEEKAENRGAGINALLSNFGNHNYGVATVFARDLEIENAETGKILNPGFEEEIRKSEYALFNWLIFAIKNVDISYDPRQPREGKRSLQLAFKGYSEPTLAAAPQLVSVEPNARYRISFAVKTADLKSAGTPLIEVVEVKTSRALGASQPFAIGTNDWQNMSFEFTMPADAQGVWLRTGRAFCGADCPIVGVVWYDDFKLERSRKN